jgi:hypothetical protein
MSQQTHQAEYPATRSPEVRREVQVRSEQRPRFELSVPKILAGALAAASAAVAASWLGVAGTVLGAVVASVVVSVTSAVYSHPLERSTQVIREVLPLRPDSYRPGLGSTQTLVLDHEPDSALDTHDDPTGDQPAPTPRRRIAWGAVVVSSLLTLVVGFGVLTAFEAIVGRSASSLTGNGHSGTTFSRILDDGSSGGGSNNHQPTTPTQTSDPGDSSPTSTQPTDSPSTDEPTTTDPTTPAPTQPTPIEPTPTEPTQTQPTGPANNAGTDDPGAIDGGTDTNG